MPWHVQVCGMKVKIDILHSHSLQVSTTPHEVWGVYPLPLQENMLCRYMYVAFLDQEGLKHRSIKSYLSGIRCLQIQQGFGNPIASPLLEFIFMELP